MKVEPLSGTALRTMFVPGKILAALQKEPQVINPPLTLPEPVFVTVKL
jgi:hypothetical protein